MANFVSFANAETLMTAIGQKLSAIEGAFTFRGSVAYANLPAVLTSNMKGYVYNVTDQFTTDARFVEGAGKKYAAGTNVVVADVGGFSEVTPVGNENPSTEGWYVLDNGNYILTSDETVQGGTTYYQYVADWKFDVIGNFVDVDGIYTEIDKVVDMISSDEFDSTQAYAIGDVVVHERSLYKFKAVHTANTAWDATEVDKVDVISLIDAAEPDSLTTAQVNALLALLD